MKTFVGAISDIITFFSAIVVMVPTLVIAYFVIRLFLF